MKKKSKRTFYIVTPSYNQANFISQTIDSVLSQKGTFSIKYLVMDGKSTDNTVSILKRYSSQIVFQSKKDAGQTDAINKGISVFNKLHPKDEDIFAYINSDDYYLPNAFQRVLTLFQKNPSKMWLIGDCFIIDAKGKQIQIWVKLYKKLLRIIGYIIGYNNLLLVANPIPQVATFVTWEAVKEIGAFSTKLKYVMDYQYWIRLSKNFGNPIFCPFELTAFRIHASSKGGSQFQKQFDEQFEQAKYFTNNKIYLFFHHIHSKITLWIYSKIK